MGIRLSKELEEKAGRHEGGGGARGGKKIAKKWEGKREGGLRLWQG